ncbi:hypothetical protein ACRALDRAFT_210935 [Sodiomyces alcalophilus JCM 7366]|uniref:uncharacterized protein n=1 Tax=Sodiomyces alcalophilus JCM 7366 TaxID=591952 RepID=UPI0039B53778
MFGLRDPCGKLPLANVSQLQRNASYGDSVWNQFVRYHLSTKNEVKRQRPGASDGFRSWGKYPPLPRSGTKTPKPASASARADYVSMYLYKHFCLVRLNDWMKRDEDPVFLLEVSPLKGILASHFPFWGDNWPR